MADAARGAGLLRRRLGTVPRKVPGSTFPNTSGTKVMCSSGTGEDAPRLTGTSSPPHPPTATFIPLLISRLIIRSNPRNGEITSHTALFQEPFVTIVSVTL